MNETTTAVLLPGRGGKDNSMMADVEELKEKESSPLTSTSRNAAAATD